MSKPVKIVLAIGAGIVGLFVACTSYVVKLAEDTEREQQQQQQKMEAQRRAQQEAFERTPEGKKARAARMKEAARGAAERLKEKNKAEAMELTRSFLADSIEKNLLGAGFDVKTGVSEKTLTLYITGEQVNRVFAHNIMVERKTVKSMRDAGFKTVTFWNGHQLTGIFTEDYDLTKP